MRQHSVMRRVKLCVPFVRPRLSQHKDVLFEPMRLSNQDVQDKKMAVASFLLLLFSLLAKENEVAIGEITLNVLTTSSNELVSYWLLLRIKTN
ncbi:hypothetical protein [Psychromonas sp. Urea-02u-13]|nr:hypothetical protein [Psychromonas sp. Urea-02u-13]PKG38541.1 hypothetical protein CXF74_12515 [Psychromonas sp. Urea-02u-13]